MNLEDLNVIVSRDLPEDEAWVIRRADAPQLPDDLRGKVSVPCILTGNLKSLRDTLKLIRLTGGAARRRDSARGVRAPGWNAASLRNSFTDISDPSK